MWGLLALVLSAEQHLDLALGAVRQGLAVGLPQHIGLLLKIEARILQATGGASCAGGLRVCGVWVVKSRAGLLVSV